MRVLLIHNGYQHHGGEDSVVEAEVALLRHYGHEVVRYQRDNRQIGDGTNRLALFANTVWSRDSQREIDEILRAFDPDVAHVHNTFPLISPSVYWTLARAGKPVVQTLHNFRLMCVQAMFLRDNRRCEDCQGRSPWRGAVRGCYRGSKSASTAAAVMLSTHRALGTYQDKVTRYIALSQFARGKFVEGGLPAERIVVKPNFVDVPATAEKRRQRGLFVGRLSAEKGTALMCEALRLCKDVRVDVIGDGPESALVKNQPQANLLGFQEPRKVYEHMQRASYLLLPNMSYENFPRTVVEAFACGLPVIASRMGATAELVQEGRTGLLFEPGSATDLAQKIAWAEANPERLREMGVRARAEYEARFTPEKNYWQLMSVYGEAIEQMKRQDNRIKGPVHG